MTIDSSWLHAFKEEAPHAFGARHPFRPHAIFVDGQIKLMQGFQREPLTWDQFIHRQFARHLQRCYETCDVLILAFDDYEHVPKAKGMTQAKRRKHVPAVPFSEHSELPCMVPEGEHWTQCIANRTFKARVIDLVLLRLPQVLLLAGDDHAQKRLIVDYKGEPQEYRFNPSERRVICQPFEAGLQPLGEADVKFTRYADRFKKLMVDSIDGDSIPIALLHFERRLRVQSDPPQISVYRMELNGPCGSAGTKRRAADGQTADSGIGSLRVTKEKQNKKRAYEFVNIPALYESLMQVVKQCSGRVALPTHRGHEMEMLVALIALTGTDFSRHLPQLSGKTVYAFLSDIWTTLAMSYDPATMTLRVPEATDMLVAHLYQTKFPKQAERVSGGLSGTLQAITQSKKLAQRTRDSLPSVARVRCTVRNANWVLAYWGNGDDHVLPNPLQPTYGFRLLPSGATEYDDRDD